MNKQFTISMGYISHNKNKLFIIQITNKYLASRQISIRKRGTPTNQKCETNVVVTIFSIHKNKTNYDAVVSKLYSVQKKNREFTYSFLETSRIEQ